MGANKNYIEQIKSKSENLSLEDAPLLWDKMESRLDRNKTKKKKYKSLFHIRIAAGFFFMLAVTSLVYLFFKPQSNVIALNNNFTIEVLPDNKLAFLNYQKQAASRMEYKLKLDKIYGTNRPASKIQVKKK